MQLSDLIKSRIDVYGLSFGLGKKRPRKKPTAKRVQKKEKLIVMKANDHVKKKARKPTKAKVKRAKKASMKPKKVNKLEKIKAKRKPKRRTKPKV